MIVKMINTLLSLIICCVPVGLYIVNKLTIPVSIDMDFSNFNLLNLDIS